MGKEREKKKNTIHRVFKFLIRECQGLGPSERAVFEAQIWIQSKHQTQLISKTQRLKHNTNTTTIQYNITHKHSSHSLPTPTSPCFILSKERERESEVVFREIKNRERERERES